MQKWGNRLRSTSKTWEAKKKNPLLPRLTKFALIVTIPYYHKTIITKKVVLILIFLLFKAIRGQAPDAPYLGATTNHHTNYSFLSVKSMI